MSSGIVHFFAGGTPVMLAAVAVFIAAVTAAASLMPTFRAARVDPLVALKDE